MSDQQPSNNQDLAQQVADAKAKVKQNIPPYIGGVAEDYLAPWTPQIHTGALEPGRIVYQSPSGVQPFSTHLSPAGYASLQNKPQFSTHLNQAGYESLQNAGNGVRPQYRVGAQNSVVLGLSPEKVYQLKQQLVDSGLAPKGILTSGGFWDSGSANAITDVLAYANVHGMTWQDALDTVAAEASTHPKPRDLLPPQILSTKSPIDLRQTADTVAQQTLGRKLTKAEQARFVSAWQTADLDYQKKQADVTLAYQQAQSDINAGGEAPSNLPPQITTMTAPPSPENAAKEQMKASPEGQAKSIADTFDAFKQLLGGIV